MNQFELRRVERELREALSGTDLQWVLDDVDDAIAAGVPEEKILRRRPHRRGEDRQPTSPAAEAARYQVLDRRELGPAEFEASRKRGTLVITTRPMTEEERVLLLLDALKRLFVELPEIEGETLKVLQSVPDSDTGSRSVIQGVVFEPDESTRPRRSQSTIVANRVAAERRESVSLLFDDVTDGVRS
ncbi:hypothetical protein ACFVX9_08420 [Kitasatospora sp. NPDC058243]|uniref:hypothetical protein n=1 Tax=Kitasatospora sp. NPDC058243 TaxID=3346397 RepID=UPI0036D9722A